VPLAARAQTPGQYRATDDTLRYRAENTYTMYFVSGSDTVGDPVATRAVELHCFADRGAELSAWIKLQADGSEPFTSETRYRVTRDGRVLAIDGRPVAQVPTARVGLLPHLPHPAVPLQAGRRWSDTVLHEYAAGHGRDRFAAWREYRVHRVFDTLGTRIAHILGVGRIELRHGGWQDSLAGTVWWQDLVGSVVDTVWFDVPRGRLVADATIMDLFGTGGAGPKGRGMVLPSGLRSEIRRRLTSP
jgi:hypothetical protein